MRNRLGLFAAVCLLCFFQTVAAQPSFQAIETNGPVSNRVNVVLLSEGYTAGQLSQFLIDATNAFNALMGRPPYQEYRSYFNAFAVSVASAQSGSDHPSWTWYKETYFNSSYDSSDRVITIPPNEYNSNYADGQGKVDALLQTFMPACNLPVLLVNDTMTGGSDGFADKTAITSIGASLSDSLTHETAHVLAGLGDEYTTANPGFPNIEEPNTTQQTQPTLIKWRAWIPAGTPIPTPETSTFASTVGLFQGAHYYVTNWFRPKLNCLMRSSGAPFCEVCSEALVLSFYRKVRPIDSYSPATRTLTITTTQAMDFAVAVYHPTAHSLRVQWSADGTPLGGSTNTSVSVLPISLSNGSHTIVATVSDPTTLVRNDPTNLLVQTVTWSLNVSVPRLQLDAPLRLPGSNFAFRVSGYASEPVVIQSTSNYLEWVPEATNSLSSGHFWYTNLISGTNQYFRAKTPP